MGSLIDGLPEGQLDIVADVHGEIDALRGLLSHLGYLDGVPPQGRQLVFLGDLIDRGPDSIGVVTLVRELMAQGARCVLGNHELNVLRHKKKPDNAWFFDLPEAKRLDIEQFFASLPLALHRDDLRVVHAAWDDAAVARLRDETDAMTCFRRYEDAIQADIEARRVTEKVDRDLLHQNDNPIKLLTSGPEQRTATPFEVNGELRHAERVRWWNDYTGPLCVVGHYWRAQGSKPTANHLFDDTQPYALLGRGRVMCIDYSVGWRFKQRQEEPAGFTGPFKLKLAALQFPEMRLVFDDGSTAPVAPIAGESAR